MSNFGKYKHGAEWIVIRAWSDVDYRQWSM